MRTKENICKEGKLSVWKYRQIGRKTCQKEVEQRNNAEMRALTLDMMKTPWWRKRWKKGSVRSFNLLSQILLNVREQFWLNDFVRTHLTGRKENTWKINIERSFLIYCYSFMWSITHHNWSCSSLTCKTTLWQPSWVITRNLHFQKRVPNLCARKICTWFKKHPAWQLDDNTRRQPP